MKQIKFSENYYKLPLPMPFKAQLMQCFKISFKELSGAFIAYDTAFKDGWYVLPKTDLIVLLLISKDAYEDYHVFTTIRRFTPQKWDYYKGNEGEDFEIVFSESNRIRKGDETKKEGTEA